MGRRVRRSGSAGRECAAMGERRQHCRGGRKKAVAPVLEQSVAVGESTQAAVGTVQRCEREEAQQRLVLGSRALARRSGSADRYTGSEATPAT